MDKKSIFQLDCSVLLLSKDLFMIPQDDNAGGEGGAEEESPSPEPEPEPEREPETDVRQPPPPKSILKTNTRTDLTNGYTMHTVRAQP